MVHPPRRRLVATAALVVAVASMFAFTPAPARAQTDDASTTTTVAADESAESTSSAESSVRVVGELRAPAHNLSCGSSSTPGPCPLLVDPVNNVGFAAGCDRMIGSVCADAEGGTQGGTVQPSLRVYDLERLAEVDRLPQKDRCPSPDTDVAAHAASAQEANNWRCGTLQAGAFDTWRRMMWVPTDVDSSGGGSNPSSGAWCGLLRYDYEVVTQVVGRAVHYDCTIVCQSGVGKCSYRAPSASLARPLTHLRVVFDGEHPDAADGTLAHLYVPGAYGEEAARRPSGATLNRNPVDVGFENAGQPLIVRQLRVTSTPSPAVEDGATYANSSVAPGLAYGWDVDLRAAGCGRRVGWSPSDPGGLRPFVARVGDDLLTYCWDARPLWWSPGPGGVGEQGYVVRIPLDPRTDAPFGDPDPTGVYTNFRYVRTPALAGYLEASVDPDSRMMLLVTDGKANGNAVWVFDPGEDRFIGVATGGAADQPLGNTALGVDAVRGRVYLLTRGGLLVVPTRTRPLQAGLLFPVALNTDVTRTKKVLSTFAPATRDDCTNIAGQVEGRTINVPGGAAEPVQVPTATIPNAVTVPDPVCTPEHIRSETRPQQPFANSALIAVAPKLRLAFLAINQPDQEARGASCSSGAADTLKCTSEKGARWLVVEDAYPDDPPAARVDADASTTQVDEVNGVTEVSARGQGAASGAHVIVAGGVTRTITQADPACRSSVPVAAPDPAGSAFLYMNVTVEAERGRATIDEGHGSAEAATPHGATRVVDTYGQSGGRSQPFSGEGCAADQVVTGGKREVFLANAKVEVGNETGSLARAAGLDFGSDDGTGSDLRNAGGCGRGTGSNVRSELDPLFDESADGCSQFWDGFADGGGPDPRAGTAGVDGKGLVGAACGDFGDKPGEDVFPEDSALGEQLVASKTVCDAANVLAKAQATTSGPLVLADQGTVLVSVARTWSKLASAKTADEGLVTAVASGAEGIRIGPVFIAKAVSVAVTKAKGRTDTASAELVRRWCGISVETPDPDNDTKIDVVPQGACVDPSGDESAQTLLATLNQVLSKVHLSVPPANSETEADGTVQEGEDSPGGFQATVIKAPDTRAGDSAVNDDETHTVSALEAVFYNDGSQGRNRVVLQLAGVAAESRYGIREVPDFGGLEDEPVVDEVVEEEAPEVAAITDPGPAPVIDLPESSGEGFRTAAVTEAPRDELTVEELLDDIIPTAATQPVYRGRTGFIDRLPPVLRTPAQAIRDAIRLLVNNPAQFGLLFATFALLAAPLYLSYRRRTFARALLANTARSA